MLQGAILFDFDDTLLPSEQIYDLVLREMNVDAEKYQIARARVKERLGKHVSARSRLLYFKELLEMEGKMTPSLLVSWTEEYERRLGIQFSAFWNRLGRERYVGRLAEKYPLYLITNETTRTQILKWRAIDPDAKYFRKILTSEEVGVEKPDEIIFGAALKMIGLPPKEVICVGDSVANDISPALKYGMKAILTTEFRDESKNVPEGVKIIKRLEELIPC